jgi:hypothetical protein
MPMLTKEEIAALETEHKRIAVVRFSDADFCVVYKKPLRAQYKQFRSRVNNETLAPDALEQLARQLVVHPSPEAFDALLEEWPAIPEGSSKALLRLMGMAADIDVK